MIDIKENFFYLWSLDPGHEKDAEKEKEEDMWNSR
jgi:hypothetical protein